MKEFMGWALEEKLALIGLGIPACLAVWAVAIMAIRAMFAPVKDDDESDEDRTP